MQLSKNKKYICTCLVLLFILIHTSEIRLPRKEFRGHRASLNKNSFGKHLTPQMASADENCSIKMSLLGIVRS